MELKEKSHIEHSKSRESNKSHPNQRVTVEEWTNRLKEHMNKLSEKQRRILGSYWQPISDGIHEATKNDRLEGLEKFEEKKESLEYNLLIKGTPYLLSNRPQKKSVKKWAKKLTSKRKYTWKSSLIRQCEAIQVMPRPYAIVFEEDGSIADIGLADCEWKLQIKPPGHNSNPEKFMLEMEIYRIVSLLTSIVGSSKKKRASEYERILELQLNGVDVKPEHGKQLGIKGDEVANRKIQAKKFAGQIFADIFPELENSQSLYRAQKGKTWHVTRSTFKERGALYQDPYVEEKEPRTIRVWKVIVGSKGQEPDSPEPLDSALWAEAGKRKRMT